MRKFYFIVALIAAAAPAQAARYDLTEQQLQRVSGVSYNQSQCIKYWTD